MSAPMPEAEAMTVLPLQMVSSLVVVSSYSMMLQIWAAQAQQDR
jgi:hypothetical protein